jgi:hypothetical protein
VDIVFHAKPYPHVKIRQLGEPSAVISDRFITFFSDEKAGMAKTIAFIEKEIQPFMPVPVSLMKDIGIKVVFIRQLSAIVVNGVRESKNSRMLGMSIQEMNLFF